MPRPSYCNSSSSPPVADDGISALRPARSTRWPDQCRGRHRHREPLATTPNSSESSPTRVTEDDIALLVGTDPKKLDLSSTSEPPASASTMPTHAPASRTRSNAISINFNSRPARGWTRLNQGLSLLVSVALGLLPTSGGLAESTLLHITSPASSPSASFCRWSADSSTCSA